MNDLEVMGYGEDLDERHAHLLSLIASASVRNVAGCCGLHMSVIFIFQVQLLLLFEHKLSQCVMFSLIAGHS